MNDKKTQDEQQIRAAINARLVESGERDRLKQLLQQELIRCGWRDQIKLHCRELVKQKGLNHITVDDIVAEMVPKGRTMVPDHIKKQLLERIRTFLAQQNDLSHN